MIAAFLFFADPTMSKQSWVAGDDSPSTFVSNWVQLFNQNDPDPLLSTYDKSNELTVVVSSGESYSGYKSIAEIYRRQFRAATFHESSARKISARKIGNTAIVHFEHSFKFQSKSDESRWQVHIQTTLILQKQKVSWKIVGEHSSPLKDKERVAPLAKKR